MGKKRNKKAIIFTAVIMLDFSGVGEKDERLYYSKYYQHIAIRGRLRALDDNEYSEVCRNLYDIIRIFIKQKKSGNGHMEFRI